ncbi:helix-turn-helix domain-containing protein, partial [Pseudomonas emilianonis]|uniref:helix-turn-helix domain-containing protein n=1 Tax=Pseudomonas emilianonis TaxID=2915812 RepID=UPI003D2FABE1
MFNAATHYQIDYPDLSLILALVRGGSLARAAALLRVDVSTVFRAVRRLEAALGQTLFEKSRASTTIKVKRNSPTPPRNSIAAAAPIITTVAPKSGSISN